MQPSTEDKAITPCIKSCQLSKEQVCTGCHRSIDEIVNWMSMTEAQQRLIVNQCSDRAAAKLDQSISR